jgi:tetratricopeptide (TPR) repeat protein
MEYAKLGRYDEAIAEYRALARNDPDYVATYYQLGKALESRGKVEEAREAYETGIAAATRQGDSHTRDELAGALGMLESG